MTAKSAGEVRRELAQGHWSLGEHAEALSCLQRAVECEPPVPGLEALLRRLLAEGEAGGVGAEIRSGLERLIERSVPEIHLGQPIEVGATPTTPTMAELLEEQGHGEQALRVAQEVLRERPADERARAIRDRLQAPHPGSGPQINVLHRWLAYFETQRRAREGIDA